MMKLMILAILSPAILLGAGCNNINSQPDRQIIFPNLPTNQNNNPKTGILNLSGKKLRSLPQSVFSETELRELNISNNELTGSIPAEIRQLAKLRILNMSNNSLTGIPAEVGQLQELEILDVSNNKITGLPLEIGNLKKLKKFILSGNNYSDFDLNKIRGMLPDFTVIETSE